MRNKKILRQIEDYLIIDRLRFENPWWETGKTEDDYKQLTPRRYFDLFHQWVTETDVKRAVVLMGPRRVGKTVMLHNSVQALLEAKTQPSKISFINIENPIYNNIGLDQLFQLSMQASGNNEPQGQFVFWDEIQYLKNWEVHLKVLVDSYPNTKFIVSGSAAAALKLKSNESGAGRFTDFILPPLTFFEYICLKNLDHLLKPAKLEWRGNLTEFYTSVNPTALNEHFLDYINYGGYPEVIFSDKIKSDPRRYIKNDIIDKVLLRDLPSLYGIQDVQELNSFFTTLAYNTGNEVSLDSLSSTSGVEKYQLRKYLEYLEAAFLIKTINRIDDNAKKFQRATFYKIFLTNPSLRSALFFPVTAVDDSIGNMVETAIYSQWMHRDWFIPWYARWTNGRTHGEVDMIGLDEKKFKPTWALEIKWSNRYFESPGELKSLVWFCKKNNLDTAMVTTIDKEGVKEFDGIKFVFVPASVYAYIVGLNTIEQKRQRNNNI
ncbi:MAG: ATP-binding protein [Bacteroidota bacterium]|nr:ATP-binding protein [Bacteroidota bacterium]